MASFGEELKRERELRGFTLREISDTTKISIRFLEALENNDFKHLPGGQFNKGFVRAYATYIGLDPEKMVNSYLLELSQQEERTRSRIRFAPPPKTKKLDPKIISLIIIVAVALIIAGAVLISIYWFSSQKKSGATPISSSGGVQSFTTSSAARVIEYYAVPRQFVRPATVAKPDAADSRYSQAEGKIEHADTGDRVT